MRDIPTELDGARVEAVAVVNGDVRPSGKTTHVVGGTALAPAHALAIVKYADETGVYLFYCDREWQVLTDTWHASVADAKAQAEFEYSGITAVWKDAV